MEIEKARRLVSLLPPKLVNFFTRYPPRNPSLRTLYSKDDKSLEIAKRLHDFQPVSPDLHKPVTSPTQTPAGEITPTVFLPFQNPFKPTRDPRSGKIHAPRYSLRRQADIIKLGMRFGVAELLPPSPKMNRLLHGKKRPMAGTLKPKGTYEERTRQQYVEKKQKSLEESLRVVAMRKTVLFLCLALANFLVAGDQKESGTKAECALGQGRTVLQIDIKIHCISLSLHCYPILISSSNCLLAVAHSKGGRSLFYSVPLEFRILNICVMEYKSFGLRYSTIPKQRSALDQIAF
jgi:large subunit ribosomal protein L25